MCTIDQSADFKFKIHIYNTVTFDPGKFKLSLKFHGYSLFNYMPLQLQVMLSLGIIATLLTYMVGIGC